MDKKSLGLIRAVWRHSGIRGNVWVPHISNIGSKNQRFVEGRILSSSGDNLPEFNTEVDWYWTPAVASKDTRKGSSYSSQRVLWVDCDDGYNDALLNKLMPSYVWETSPGHKQAVWLINESIPASEYSRDGFMGMLAQAINADPSGVDIGQLLRVPGSVHHKGKPFTGRVLKSNGTKQTLSQLLTRTAKALGFSPAVSSELGADSPYGDRSKQLWRFERNAAEIGLSQDLAFKLLRACKWNKWRDDPERLKEDIAKAYGHQPPDKPLEDAKRTSSSSEEEISAWDLSPVAEFGTVIRKPLNWVVPNVIPESGCGLLVAAPKVGKTRLAIEIALGLATGTAPMGIKVRKPKAVGFFSLEDGQYLFSTRMNHSLNHDKGRHKFHWDGHISSQDNGLQWNPSEPMQLLTGFESIDLNDGNDKQRLYETITRYDLDLVVIDTLSMAIGKADVSSSTDMYAILKDVKDIAKETKCAIMFIHHTRKRMFEKGESIQEQVLGSTALHAWCDFILSLAAPKEEGDFLRLGVQTKMDTRTEFVNDDLKIIHKPKIDTEE